MKITKSLLKQIIREELVNEIGVPISQVGGGAPVADPHALRELVENVQADVAEFEDDMRDKLAGEGSSGFAPREI